LVPKDFAYQFELVRALMRTGLKQEAIGELRKLILADLKYWTAAAIDRSLDPMRAEIDNLLSKMREEERVAANNLLEEFLETIRAVESFPESLPIEFRSANEWKKSMELIFEKRTIFAYREVVETVSASHRTFIEMVIERYKEGISAEQARLADLENSSLASLAAIRAQIPWLIGQANEVKSQQSLQEAQIKNQYKSREGGYGCALGCTGCLSVFGLFGCFMILVLFRAASGGQQDLRWTLLIYFPLALILPLMVGGRWAVFRGKRNDVRHAAYTKLLDIESKARAAEESARDAEKKGSEELEPRRAEFERLRSIYRDNIALLERRLAIVTAK
jgi:hypothetical protein